MIADWNPVSALAAAARHLLGSPVAPANGAWPLLHPVIASLAWTALLLVDLRAAGHRPLRPRDMMG